MSNGTLLSESDLFQALAPTAPSTLTRSMIGNYVMGIYGSAANQIFILLSTENYGQAYSGMLDWEPSLQSDLSSLFPLSNTSTTTVPIWSDDTFENRDVRVLHTGTNGPITLVYGFLDNGTLLITSSENVFQAVANKYLSAKLVH